MINEYDVRAAIKPLRLIFWGGLLWILDFKINGFDILNDVVASILVAIGVSRLASVQVSDRYCRVMWWVRLIAWLSVPIAIYKMFPGGAPEPIATLLTLCSVAQLASIVAFCMAMRWFCLEAGLMRSARSWWLTTILFLALYAGPLGLLMLGIALGRLIGQDWSIHLGAEVLLVLIVLLVPFVHFFMSSSRMRREAEGGGEMYSGHAFPVIPINPPPPPPAPPPPPPQ